jgi:hypothetical protein
MTGMDGFILLCAGAFIMCGIGALRHFWHSLWRTA